MERDVDAIVASMLIDRLSNLLGKVPHGEREEIADDIITFVESMERKYKQYLK